MHYHYLTIEQRETLQGLIESRMKEQPALKPALEFLHSPDYGVCVACGGDIAYTKLLADPAARHCRTCEPS
jgi:RNA polymerase-binding transcription factor DksA